MKSIHLIISGKVQGVFFRANVKKRAQELNLRGYAKNLDDGNVEVAAEGDENKINELIKFIKKGPGIAKVKDIKIKETKQNNFENFKAL